MVNRTGKKIISGLMAALLVLGSQGLNSGYARSLETNRSSMVHSNPDLVILGGNMSTNDQSKDKTVNLIGTSSSSTDSLVRTASTTTKKELVNNTYTTGFPIVKNKITLKVMTLREPMHGDFNTMAFTKDYEAKTNIHIQWDLVLPSEHVEKKTLALMSGNLPHIMAMVDAFNSADIITYGSEKLIKPIDGLLAKWAPNVKKAVDSSKEVKTSITAPDGHIYSVPKVQSVIDHMLFTEKMYINKTWLDALELKVPTTYKELTEVLRAFKEGDPNGNGQTDEIPLAVTGFNPMLAGAPQGINWYWDSDRMYVDNNDKVGYFMATNAYRDSIKFFKTLWSEKLMDQGVFEGRTMVTTRTMKGTVGCFVSLAGVLALKEADLKNYTMIGPIKSTSSSKPTVPARTRQMVLPFSYVITAANKYPEASLRWIDYFYTPQGYWYVENGPENAGFYKKLSNGKLQTVQGKKDQDRYKLAPGFVLPSWFSQSAKDLMEKRPDSQLGVVDKYFLNVDEGMSKKLYLPYVQKKTLPNMFFSKQATSRIKTLSDPIHSYAFNWGMAFVKGEANIDTGWNDFLTELNKLGVKEFVDIYQKAYNSTLK